MFRAGAGGELWTGTGRAVVSGPYSLTPGHLSNASLPAPSDARLSLKPPLLHPELIIGVAWCALSLVIVARDLIRSVIRIWSHSVTSSPPSWLGLPLPALPPSLTVFLP